MNFTTNKFNISLISTIETNPVIFGETTKKDFLSSLVTEANENSWIGAMDEATKNTVKETAIEANALMFEEAIKNFNASNEKDHFKFLQNLFVINKQDIYIAEGDESGFVTYHYLEDQLLLDAVKSFTEMANEKEGDFEIHEFENVFYSKSGIIDLNKHTLTICLSADVMGYVTEVAEVTFNDNLKRLEEFPDLKAAVETLYI